MSKPELTYEANRNYVSDPARLRALLETELMDSESEEGFDSYTRLANRFLGSQVSLISLVDSERQFFKSQVGLHSPWCDMRGTPLDESMCATVVESKRVLRVDDTRKDPHWRDHLAVTNIGVGSYLGCPIHAPDGHVLGSFCVIDSAPRQWTDIEQETLALLTRMLESKVRLRCEIEKRNQIAIRLNQTNLQLREYSEKVKRIMAVMAHEIRTSVTSLKGHGEIAASSGDPAERDASVQAIRQNTDHLLRLVNDILETTRIETGAIRFESIVFDPVELTQDILVSLEPNVAEGHVSLHFAPTSADIPKRVAGDPTRIRQILMNLATNALKFTERGSVTLRLNFEPVARRAGDSSSKGIAGVLQWEVSDTGPGISPEQLERLFHPYQQADSSVFRRYGGSGMGLYISKELAEAMGGSIEASSQVGQGSTFRVHVPVDMPEADVEAQRKPKSETLERLSGKPRVLVVEDTPDIQVVQRFLLKRLGCEPEIATSGQDAIRRVRQGVDAFDVILIDVHMPDMDGFETTKAIRDIGFRGPILAHSATINEQDYQGMLAAGCDDYLEKPLDPKRFVSLVRQMIENSDARNRNPLSSDQPTPQNG